VFALGNSIYSSGSSKRAAQRARRGTLERQPRDFDVSQLVFGCEDLTSVFRCVCVLLLQDLLYAWGGRRVEDMCYERRRSEACVDESAHHALGPVRNPVL